MRLLTYQTFFADIDIQLWKNVECENEVIDFFCISTNFCTVSGQQWSSLSVKAATIISIIEKLLTGTDTFPVIKSAEGYTVQLQSC